MISNSYIHEQIAAAHHRDLLEAAEHAQLIAQAHQHHPVPKRSMLHRRAPPRMSMEPRQRAGPDLRTTTTPTPTR